MCTVLCLLNTEIIAEKVIQFHDHISHLCQDVQFCMARIPRYNGNQAPYDALDYIAFCSSIFQG